MTVSPTSGRGARHALSVEQFTRDRAADVALIFCETTATHPYCGVLTTDVVLGRLCAPSYFDPAALLIRQEQEAAFMELLNQLAPPQRSVFLLHFLEAFSIEDIAGITGAPLGTVKSRLHYAKRALRKLLEDQANENSA